MMKRAVSLVPFLFAFTLALVGFLTLFVEETHAWWLSAGSLIVWRGGW